MLQILINRIMNQFKKQLKKIKSQLLKIFNRVNKMSEDDYLRILMKKYNNNFKK